MPEQKNEVQLGRDVFIAPTSFVGGKVTLGDHCTIMHNVTIRGDVAGIRLGSRVNVQDNAMLHTAKDVPLEIEDQVSIAHCACVHCSRVGRGTLVGIGAILLDGVEIGTDCLVAAGAVVTPGTKVPDGSLVIGSPGRVRRELRQEEKAYIQRVVGEYVELGRRHRNGEFPNAVNEYRNRT